MAERWLAAIELLVVQALSDVEVSNRSTHVTHADSASQESVADSKLISALSRSFTVCLVRRFGLYKMTHITGID